MLRRSLVVAALLAGSALTYAQGQAVFRVETNYVEVDAVVTDADGRFVPGLTAADFEVREQRKPQDIRAFSYIDLPVGPAAASATPSAVRFRPDLPQAERIAADRIYLIYLNGVGSLLVRHRALDFVRDFMQPQDIAAVWDAEAPPRTLTFTNDKGALLKQIARDAGSTTASLPYRERAEIQGARLRDAVDWLGAIQGRRKSLILFTEGWAPDNLSEFQRINREREITEWLQGRRRGLITGGTWLSPTDITDRSDVHIYSYDVRGLVAPVPNSVLVPKSIYNTTADQISESYRAASESATALRSIADQTGGLAFVDSNDYRLGFARIVDDNSRYYILGYYSPNTKRDGFFRSLDVRVHRPGLRVRARDGYVAR